jgi:hypothetical protein
MRSPYYRISCPRGFPAGEPAASSSHFRVVTKLCEMTLSNTVSLLPDEGTRLPLRVSCRKRARRTACTPIGIMHPRRGRLAPPYGHLQGVDHKLGSDVPDWRSSLGRRAAHSEGAGGLARVRVPSKRFAARLSEVFRVGVHLRTMPRGSATLQPALGSGQLSGLSSLLELRFDPAVGGHQSFLQRDLGLPLQHSAESIIVAVPTPNPLRL